MTTPSRRVSDETDPSQLTRREHSLDGLRGVAALIVLIYHAMLTWPVLDKAVGGEIQAVPYSWEWWATYTPLHIFWLGPEAVYVFFILSGFVLTGPALSSRFRWSSYYRKRLPRLYLPVWGSIVVAAIMVAIVPRQVEPGFSDWTNGHQGVSSRHALMEATLLIPVEDRINGPLWSLTWEMWFSLLLPLYIAVAYWARKRIRRAFLVVPALFLIMAASVATSAALRFLPMFALGVLMYVYRDELRAFGRWIGARRCGWSWVIALSVILMTCHWMLQVFSAVPDAIVSASRLLQIAGAAMVIFVVLCWEPAKRTLNATSLQWLGSRSFSLYLTHDPVVSTVAIVLGPGTSPFLVLALALPICLVLCEVFFRIVEIPSQKLANWVGRGRKRLPIIR